MLDLVVLAVKLIHMLHYFAIVNMLKKICHEHISSVCHICSFEGDLRVYFQCDGQDRVHIPDITIEVSIAAHAPCWALRQQHQLLSQTLL